MSGDDRFEGGIRNSVLMGDGRNLDFSYEHRKENLQKYSIATIDSCITFAQREFSDLGNINMATLMNYFHKVINLKQSQEITVDLLSIRLNNCDGLLHTAIKKNDISLIINYMKIVWVNKHHLTSTVIAQLLSAKNEDGVPGLFMALQHSNKEAVKKYIELLLKDFKYLGDDIIQELLLCKNKYGIPGFLVGLKQFNKTPTKIVLKHLKVKKSQLLNRDDFFHYSWNLVSSLEKNVMMPIEKMLPIMKNTTIQIAVGVVNMYGCLNINTLDYLYDDKDLCKMLEKLYRYIKNNHLFWGCY